MNQIEYEFIREAIIAKAETMLADIVKSDTVAKKQAETAVKSKKTEKKIEKKENE